jgi:hypothetical protein
MRLEQTTERTSPGQRQPGQSSGEETENGKQDQIEEQAHVEADATGRRPLTVNPSYQRREGGKPANGGRTVNPEISPGKQVGSRPIPRRLEEGAARWAM